MIEFVIVFGLVFGIGYAILMVLGRIFLRLIIALHWLLYPAERTHGFWGTILRP